MPKQKEITLLSALPNKEIYINKILVFNHMNAKPINGKNLKCRVTFLKRDKNGKVVRDNKGDAKIVVVDDFIRSLELTVIGYDPDEKEEETVEVAA